MRDEFKQGYQCQIILQGCDEGVIQDDNSVLSILSYICETMGAPRATDTKSSYGRNIGCSVSIVFDTGCATAYSDPIASTVTIEIYSIDGLDASELDEKSHATFGSDRSDVRITRVRHHSPSKIEEYPNFPEYILSEPPIGKFPHPYYRRGAGRRYIFDPEALAWQTFFNGVHYNPPSGKDILLLHPCSWAKPYDFSKFVSSLREVTDRYPRVHRAIISNVGIIPYEYQMNEIFCSYDYVLDDPSLPNDCIVEMREDFQNITYERISKYITANIERYRGIVVLGHPVSGGYQQTAAAIAKRKGIPGFAVPSIEAYEAARPSQHTNTDYDTPLFSQQSLTELSTKLPKLINLLDKNIS